MIETGPDRVIDDETMPVFIVDADIAAMKLLDVPKKTVRTFYPDLMFRVIFEYDHLPSWLGLSGHLSSWLRLCQSGPMQQQRFSNP